MAKRVSPPEPTSAVQPALPRVPAPAVVPDAGPATDAAPALAADVAAALAARGLVGPEAVRRFQMMTRCRERNGVAGPATRRALGLPAA